MTSTSLRAAVAAALALGGISAAQAFDISAYNPATAVNIHISGSTAQDSSLLAAVTDAGFGICSGGDVYQIDTGNVAKPTQRLYLCSANASSGVAAGTQIAIWKESNVGSANGVGPLITVSKGGNPGVNFINTATLADAQCTAGLGAANKLGMPAAWNSYTGCASAVSVQAPNAGLADVDGPLLRNPGSGTAFSGNDLKLLNAKAGYDIVWGVPVTKNLYYALQSAENLSASCPVDASGNALPGTGGYDDKSCAPSLSKAQIASLYSGTLSQWTQLGLNNPSGDNQVYVCKRDIGSGTEASFEQYFLHARCGGAGVGMAAQDSFAVFTNSGGGAVETCMNAIAYNGTGTPPQALSIPGVNELGYGVPPVVTPTGGGWAIGVLSSEINMTSSPTEYKANNDAFRFVAINGVFPTLANVINGFDDFWSATACYTIKSGTGVPSSSQLAVFNATCGNLGNKNAILATDTKYRNQPQNFDGGDLAPPTTNGLRPAADMPATLANARTDAINAFYKSASGALNNCDEPVLFDTAAVGNDGQTPGASKLLGNGNVNQ